MSIEKRSGAFSFKDVPELKKKIARAEKNGDDDFKWKGKDVHVNYAKYVVQFFEMW